MRCLSFILIALPALWLSGCPAVPEPRLIEDAIYEAVKERATPVDDTSVVPDVSTTPEPVEFGPCESALDCRPYPNSASICDHNECALQCVPGFANCDRELFNGCEQSLSTPQHCTACNSPCEPTNGFGSCATGSCLVAACNLGFGDCDGFAANGCETMLVTPENCDGCGVLCAPDNAVATCDAGICAIDACLEHFGDCDDALENGCETDVTTRQNCGACGVVCSPGRGCHAGRCSPVIAPPLTLPCQAQDLLVSDEGAIFALGTATTAFQWGDEGQMVEVLGASDVLLISLDAAGDPSWMTTLGGLNTERASALVHSAADRITITGTYQSGTKFGGALLPHTGGDDVFLITYDLQGEPQWGLGFGGPGEDHPTALDAGDDGTLALVGSANSPSSFGDAVLTSDAHETLGAIATFASSGVALWSRAVTSPNPVSLLDVSIGAEGAVHVLAAGNDAELSLDDVVLGQGPMIITLSRDGVLIETTSVPLDEVRSMGLGPDDILWVAGRDLEGEATLWQAAGDEAITIALPAVEHIALGDAGQLYVLANASAAFDVGLGPVVVEGAFVAHYDPLTTEARWLVAIEDSAPVSAIAATAQGIAVAGEQLTLLED